MNSQCLRCNTVLGDDFQLIFDETGVEMRLDKLLAEHFEICIKKSPTKIQALCIDCVNELIELYDVTQKNREQQTAEDGPSIDFELKTEQDVVEEDYDVQSDPENEEEFLGFCDELDAFDDRDSPAIHDQVDPTIREYVHEVIKTDLQEITYDQNTECRLCEEVLKSHTAVLMHTAECHETPESKKYPCIMCVTGGEFDSIKDLAHHIVFKHYNLDDITVYCMCPECGKRFSNFTQYNKHSCYKKTVGSRLLRECLACDTKFSSNKRYRFHLQFHLEKYRPQSCLICCSAFTDENDFFEHIMYSHEKGDLFVCKKCDRLYATKKLYDNHMKLHNAVRTFHCEFCSSSYFYKQMLTNHVQRHHNTTTLNKCSICGKSLASKHLLSRHMQLRHLKETEESVHECSACGLVAACEGDIKCRDVVNSPCQDVEITVVRLKIAYACEFCEHAYNTVENLKAHRSVHDKSSFKCWICESEYSEYKKLKTHIITHNTFDSIQNTFPINRHYVCDFDSCNQTYLTWPSLRAHKARHIADAKFSCKVCTQSFRTRGQLNTHLKAHENNEEYPCQFCPKMCFSQMSLAVHIARKHNNNFKTCPTCKSTYNTEEALKEHIEANHIELKCEHCGKITKNKRNLGIHIQMVHTKVKRFFCSTCNKGYYNNSDLKVHEKAAHAESHKFKCQHCDFTTSYETSFNAHVLKHGTKKPFKCDMCAREFTRKTCFKLHILRHSSVKPYVCPVEGCGRSFVTRGIFNSHFRDSHPDVDSSLKANPLISEKQSAEDEREPEANENYLKYIIMDVDPESAAVEGDAGEGDVVIFEESNAEDDVLMECHDELEVD